MRLEPEDAEELEEQLHEHEGLKHLRVKTWGQALIIQSGDPKDPQKHAKLNHLGRDAWNLSFPRHNGRWERTPFVGKMEDVIDTLVNDFSFYLEKL